MSHKKSVWQWHVGKHTLGLAVVAKRLEGSQHECNQEVLMTSLSREGLVVLEKKWKEHAGKLRLRVARLELAAKGQTGHMLFKKYICFK